MTPFHFLSNSVSDRAFETYLNDIHRLNDYLVVRDTLLPNLLASIDQLPRHLDFRFTCTNRFEGKHPTLRIQCPVGFVPDLIYVEFPGAQDCFVVKQTSQEFKLLGMTNLENHLRVLLMMGLAHWSPK